MNNYLLPSDYEFVESIAKAIAKDRLHRDANNAMMGLVGTTLEDSEVFEKSFDHVFESLWNRTTEDDIDQKKCLHGRCKGSNCSNKSKSFNKDCISK